MNEIVKQCIDNYKTKYINHKKQSLTKDTDIRDYDLSNDQLEIYNKICSKVDKNKSKTFLIQGYAGTGKSFLVGKLIARLAQVGYKIHCTATTNKAVKVSKSMCNYDHYNIEYSTVHSFLGLKRRINYVTGEEYFDLKDITYYIDQRLKTTNVLFIDECSQLNRSTYDILNDIRKKYKITIIYIGDPMQTPPVKEDESEVFKNKHNKSYILTKIVRQSETEYGIIPLSLKLRENIDKRYIEYRNDTVDNKGVHVINPKVAFNDVINELFKSNIYKKDSDFVKICSYTNERVDKANDYIRKMLYGKNVEEYMKGEKYIVNNAMLSPHVLVTTNSELQILNMKSSTLMIPKFKIEYVKNGIEIVKEFSLYVDYKECLIKCEDVEHPEIRILEKNEKVKLNRFLTSFKNTIFNIPNVYKTLKQELWEQFYYIKNLFADIKYNYAITIHKSQGSTYDNCIVLLKDTERNYNIVQKNKLLYTAITRASNNVFLING